jgi:hypothetical protein
MVVLASTGVANPTAVCRCAAKALHPATSSSTVSVVLALDTPFVVVSVGGALVSPPAGDTTRAVPRGAQRAGEWRQSGEIRCARTRQNNLVHHTGCSAHGMRVWLLMWNEMHACGDTYVDARPGRASCAVGLAAGRKLQSSSRSDRGSKQKQKKSEVRDCVCVPLVSQSSLAGLPSGATLSTRGMSVRVVVEGRPGEPLLR